MELNLKKNLFRYGKNESLTFGVIVALILFDILIWNLMTSGINSMDYSFARNNDCRSQAHDILNEGQVASAFSRYYPDTQGKYCEPLQKEYQKARSDISVSKQLAQIHQIQDHISLLREEIWSARRTLDKNATAYGLAIQEQKGLDLTYTEKLTKIQNQEQELKQAEKNLKQENQAFEKLPAIQTLVRYTSQNMAAIHDRYEFMQKLDLFLTYVFAMLFVLILIPVFVLLRGRLARKEKYIRLLLVNHIILIAALQGVFITIRFILHILPETLLQRIIFFFRSMHLMALWYYLAIILLFALFAGVVYFLQTKGRRRNLYKKLIKGKCWSCGARILDSEYCFSCGERQLTVCPHCHQKTYRKMPYCRFCGQDLKIDTKE